MYDTTDTIAAIATPLGEKRHRRHPNQRKQGLRRRRRDFSEQIFPSLSAAARSVHTVRPLSWTTTAKAVDEVILLIMKGPRSYTAEDVLEIQCHGGRLVFERNSWAWSCATARGWPTPVNLPSGPSSTAAIDLAQAEAVMDVIQAKSAQGHDQRCQPARRPPVPGRRRHAPPSDRLYYEAGSDRRLSGGRPGRK